jgi:hypothetical protein
LEETILQVLIAYLYDGKSHREIQREILNLPAPARGGGFVAMDILHYFNIKGDKKGVLSSLDINNEISRSDGNYLKALKLVKEYIDTELKAKESLKTKTFDIDTSNTEILGTTKIRINQNVLREYVLQIYDNKCSLCNIDKKDLLVCSHIKPWSVDEKNRLNPSNAICFCVLHDKLFDRGYFSLDNNYRIIFGVKTDLSISSLFNGLSFRKPAKDMPSIEFLKYHLEEMCN